MDSNLYRRKEFEEYIRKTTPCFSGPPTLRKIDGAYFYNFVEFRWEFWKKSQENGPFSTTTWIDASGKWFFKDEGENEHGPFDTQEIAISQLLKYCFTQLDGKFLVDQDEYRQLQEELKLVREKYLRAKYYMNSVYGSTTSIASNQTVFEPWMGSVPRNMCSWAKPEDQKLLDSWNNRPICSDPEDFVKFLAKQHGRKATAIKCRLCHLVGEDQVPPNFNFYRRKRKNLR